MKDEFVGKFPMRTEMEILDPDRKAPSWQCYIDNSDPEITDLAGNLIKPRKVLKPGDLVKVQTLLGILPMTVSKSGHSWIAETESSIIGLNYKDGCWRSDKCLINKKALEKLHIK